MAFRLLLAAASSSQKSSDEIQPEEESMRAITGVFITAAVAVTMSACALEDEAPVPGDKTTLVETEESLSAQTNAVACPKEFFCAYSGANQTGTRLLAQAGNWSGSVSGVNSAINNGKPSHGVDHVEVVWHQGSECWKRCVHYSPGPGVFAFNIPNGQVNSITWRGECAHGEDVSQRCCPGCQ